MQKLPRKRRTLPAISRYVTLAQVLLQQRLHHSQLYHIIPAALTLIYTMSSCSECTLKLKASFYHEHKWCRPYQLCNVQNEVESQYTELLSQSQADMSVGNNDEGDVERDLREMNQILLQMQQELISVQANYDRARASEEEALNTWESKRSICTLANLLGISNIP